MKCKEERCGCGQDLTGIDVEPVMWTIVNGERVPYTECPRCLCYCFLVGPESVVEPEPPKLRGTHRRAPEPKSEAPAEEEAPAEAPEPEE